MSDQFFWYVTRSAAIVTWLSAAASILIGLMTSARVLGRRPTIPWLVDLHRLFAAMSVTFLGVHMASLWFDSFVRFRFDDLLIPWAASVPGLTETSLALGVIAAWLMAAVQLSSLIKDRLNERLWRSIHLLSYGTLILGTLHALQAGSDVDNPLLLGIGMSVLTAVSLATVVRVVRYRQYRQGEQATNGQTPQAQAMQQPVSRVDGQAFPHAPAQAQAWDPGQQTRADGHGQHHGQHPAHQPIQQPVQGRGRSPG